MTWNLWGYGFGSFVSRRFSICLDLISKYCCHYRSRASVNIRQAIKTVSSLTFGLSSSSAVWGAAPLFCAASAAFAAFLSSFARFSRRLLSSLRKHIHYALVLANMAASLPLGYQLTCERVLVEVWGLASHRTVNVSSETV